MHLISIFFRLPNVNWCSKISFHSITRVFKQLPLVLMDGKLQWLLIAHQVERL